MKQRLLLMLFGIMVFAVMGCESDSESDSALCGQTWKYFVINLVLSEYVCKFAIVKQFSCGIYGQTDTEDKRYRYLPRNAEQIRDCNATLFD